MVEVGYYRNRMKKRKFKDIYFSVEEDIDTILEIPSQKRSPKQKKLLDYLRQLKRLAKNRKKDLSILYKIDKLL